MNEEMVEKIGKGKYDKTNHILKYDKGYWKRICTWQAVDGDILEANIVACQNCKVRQHDRRW